MTASTLLADAVVGSVSAALFVTVGVLNLRRAGGDRGTERARRAFSTWWIGLGTLTASTAARSFLGAFDLARLPAMIFLELTRSATICLALWGLSSYLLFIYRGRHDLEPFVRAYFAGLFVALVGVLWWTRPVGVDVGEWTVNLANARPLSGLPLLAVVLLILGPPPILAIAYAGLYPKVADPAAKRRVLIVSGTLIAWFSIHIVANATAIGQSDAWPLAARGVAIAAAGVLVLAYLPAWRAARGAGA